MYKIIAATLLAGVATTALAQPSPPAASTNPLPPSQSSTLSSAPGADAKPAADVKTAADAKTFVDTAAVAGLFEVETSRLAVHQASSARLKKFAQKMISDHSKANKELETLVQTGKIAEVAALPQALDAEHQKLLDELKGLKGKAFDERYHQIQLEAHQQAVDLFQGEAQAGEDANLKKWAAKTLPHIKDHLKRIEAIKVAT